MFGFNVLLGRLVNRVYLSFRGSRTNVNRLTLLNNSPSDYDEILPLAEKTLCS